MTRYGFTRVAQFSDKHGPSSPQDTRYRSRLIFTPPRHAPTRYFCSTVTKPPHPSGTHICLLSTSLRGFGLARGTESEDCKRSSTLLGRILSIGLRLGEVATDDADEESGLGLAGVCEVGVGGPQPPETPRALRAPSREPRAEPNDVRRGGSAAPLPSAGAGDDCWCCW